MVSSRLSGKIKRDALSDKTRVKNAGGRLAAHHRLCCHRTVKNPERIAALSDSLSEILKADKLRENSSARRETSAASLVRHLAAHREISS